MRENLTIEPFKWFIWVVLVLNSLWRAFCTRHLLFLLIGTFGGGVSILSLTSTPYNTVP